MTWEQLPTGTWTPAALLGLAVLLLLFGRLVPRRTYDDIKEDRDRWQRAHKESEAARAELVANLNALLESSRTTESLIRSLHQPPPGGPE